jgi:cyclopropane fatty-acyl-phospholipid synthase-like methyltransferase
MEYPWKTEKEFYDLHSEKLFSGNSFYHATMIGKTKEEFAEYVIGRLKLKTGDKVIDLGCGSGYLVSEISKICDCTGISTSPECIKQCRINYPECKFQLGDMESYQASGVTHFIELEAIGYPDMKRTFENVFSNLKSGGIFYAKDVFYYYKETTEQKENREYWESYFKYKISNVPEFVELGYQAGFQLLEYNDLSSKVNLEIFLESLKKNIVEFKYPHPDVWCHIAGEFIFQKP